MAKAKASGPKKVPALTMPAVDAYDALCAVLTMVSKDDTRPHLRCVHVRSTDARQTPKDEVGQVEFFGTNGHCVARWKQRLDGAPTRSFNIDRRCAIRMCAHLKDVLAEHARALKEWQIKEGWRAKDADPKPKPEEPTITFGNGVFTTMLAETRLDLVDEKYPRIDKIVDTKFGGTPQMIGVSSVYLAQAVACFQKAAHTRGPVPIIQEWEGDTPLSMMRFRTDSSLGGFGGLNRAFHLTVFVMPMRVE